MTYDWAWMTGRRPLTKISSLSSLSSNYSLMPSSRCISPPYPPCRLVGFLNDRRLGLDDGSTTVNKTNTLIGVVLQLQSSRMDWFTHNQRFNFFVFVDRLIIALCFITNSKGVCACFCMVGSDGAQRVKGELECRMLCRGI
jgi:hypothetical protein